MRRIVCALAAMMLALACIGCQAGGPVGPKEPRYNELPPVPDRLRAFYQELQAGRYEVLADLEQAPQAQVFRVEGGGESHLSIRRNRLATGAGSLEVRLDGPASTLVADNDQAREWALPRDWHRYELLMASIYAPAPSAATLQIRSGTEQVAVWNGPALPLQTGWNLVRIDLADVARQVNLTDIRQIRMQIRTGAWPFTCYLDDLLLADNTTVVYGDPKAPEGSLYVVKKGRRIHVGSTGRFELVFARGMLSNWYDLSVDPDKAVDLAGGGPAGPVLTAIDQTGVPGAIGIDSWERLGRSVRTQQQVVETNSLVCDRQGHDPPGGWRRR